MDRVETLYELSRDGRLDRRRSSGCSARSGASWTASSRSPPRRNTSLAVVRRALPKRCSPPRSALVAAIPAVIAYNKLSTDFGRYAGRLEPSHRVQRILSRQLDERP
jgi:hypothetical protein